MQVYANPNRVPLKTIFFFAAVLFVAFLPVSSFLFFLKNDAFSGYFPPKFFMSESIHAGHLPLWNPYINFGIPQYGDMSSGYWSPLTWLIASTVGYNAYTLTLEVLFYILAGAIGMYQLTGAFKLDNRVRVIAAIAFMCCGYNIGHLQHFNWLSGAAFLPWVFWSYLLLLNSFSIQNMLRAVLLFYMLIASAHPGIIISAAYFFTGMMVFHFFSHATKTPLKKKVASLFITHGILVVLFLLLAAGMIAGYLDILPFFVRGEKISLADSLMDPTNLQSWISALFPFATMKNNDFYNTDPSMRNCYFGVTLLLFFILACFSKKNAWQKYLLVAGLLFALLSAGGIFKTLAYKFVPLIGYVRLNGEFRVFALLCFILFAAIELDRFIRQKNKFTGAIVWIYYTIEIIVMACITIGLYKAISGRQSFIYHTSVIFSQSTIALKLKALIDAISFYDTYWIQGIVQVFILWGIKWCIRFSNWRLLQNIVIADMIIASLLNIPFTGTGKASVAQVQQVLNKSPRGISAPLLQPINNIDSLPANEAGLVGDWSLYNKQVGVKEQVPYPIILKNMNAYFENNGLHPGDNFLQRPFIFLANTAEKNRPTIQSFSPNEIAVSVNAKSSGQLILQQNFYPHWFYQTKAGKTKVDQAGINFMAAPVQSGENDIHFIFEPFAIKRAMLLSSIIFVIYCLLLFIPVFKRPIFMLDTDSTNT